MNGHNWFTLYLPYNDLSCDQLQFLNQAGQHIVPFLPEAAVGDINAGQTGRQVDETRADDLPAGIDDPVGGKAGRRLTNGGNSAIGDEFFQYISPVPFNQYPKAKIKYSALQKETYRMRYEKTKDRSWRATRKKPNGLVEDITSSSIKLRRNPLRFKGKVYLLTGISTFSSAGSFAQCFKYYKMGKIIGEETGGWIIHYGDVINASLPNSKLGLTISHKMWFEAGAQENDFHGTAPDIKVAAEKAMEYTLELIKKQ